MRRLFLLRPEPRASATAERAERIGLVTVRASLFAIAPLEWSAPDLAGFDGLLLTSANAVRFGGGKLELMRGLPAHAVGEATAAAARAAGLTIATIGRGGVEALLAEIAPETRLLHLCGEHRIAASASKHGIAAIPIYRAEALPRPAALDGVAGNVAAVHSPRAGARLAELVAASERSKIRIAAISEAAADASGTGWQQVEAAQSTDDDALLALAARLCKTLAQQ